MYYIQKCETEISVQVILLYWSKFSLACPCITSLSRNEVFIVHAYCDFSKIIFKATTNSVHFLKDLKMLKHLLFNTQRDNSGAP